MIQDKLDRINNEGALYEQVVVDYEKGYFKSLLKLMSELRENVRDSYRYATSMEEVAELRGEQKIIDVLSSTIEGAGDYKALLDKKRHKVLQQAKLAEEVLERSEPLVAELKKEQ